MADRESLEAGGASPRVVVGQGNVLEPNDITGGIRGFFAANLATDEGNADARIGMICAITGLGYRNSRTRPAEKAHDDTIARALWLLGHRTLQTKILKLRGDR